MEYTGSHQPVWRALFHPTRRQIIRLLEEKSRTTGELSNFFDVTRYAVMKHLSVLEQADLIHVKREGRLRWNVLNPERLQEVPAEYLERWQSGKDHQTDMDTVKEIESRVISLEYQVTLPVSTERLYQALLHQIDSWWPERRLDGSKVILEPHIGGRFYEVTEQGAAFLYGFITGLRPSREIRFFGPMDAVDEAAVSTVHIQLEEADGRTRLHLTHRTAGEVDASLITFYANDWEIRLNQHLRTFLSENSSMLPASDCQSLDSNF